MSIKLNSFVLPKNVIERMNIELKRSNKTGLEYGFSLCTMPETNIIIDKQHCVGEQCKIKIERKCDEKEKYVGSYHTHPDGSARMSSADMVSACLVDINCVGGEENKIKCFVRPKIQPEWKHAAKSLVCHYASKEFYEKIEMPMNKKFDEIHTESTKIKESVNRYIKGEVINKEELNTRIRIHNNNIRQFAKDAEKYDQRIGKLIDEFFNTIEIK